MNQFQRALTRLHLFQGNLDGDSSKPEPDMPHAVADLHAANLISSLHRNADLLGGRCHDVVLDIDLPVKVLESTNGNTHLLIEANVPEDIYFELLDALAACGIVEPGYVNSSKVRGYSAVRLPWIVKHDKAPEAVPLVSENEPVQQQEVAPWSI